MGKGNSWESLTNSLLGIVVAGGLFAIVAIVGKLLFGKEVLGAGDIKFIAAVGACFGLYPPAWFFVIFVGSVIGTIMGLVLMLLGKGKWFTPLPFGPFLAIAGYLWILCGMETLNHYFMFCRVLG